MSRFQLLGRALFVVFVVVVVFVALGSVEKRGIVFRCCLECVCVLLLFEYWYLSSKVLFVSCYLLSSLSLSLSPALPRLLLLLWMFNLPYPRARLHRVMKRAVRVTPPDPCVFASTFCVCGISLLRVSKNSIISPSGIGMQAQHALSALVFTPVMFIVSLFLFL